jgi:hypothetical protein
MKNPACAAVTRKAEEDWGKRVTELERKHLVEINRRIAECKSYIIKQRDLIRKGDSTRSLHGSGGGHARSLRGKFSHV